MRRLSLSFASLLQCLVLLGLLGMPLAAMPVGAAPFAYVTNSVSSTVSVIATATNTVVATVPGFSLPREVAITPDGTHAYVTNQSANTVSVIATATNTVVATVLVEFQPIAVAITPNGTHAYVTNAISNSVSVIATATNTVVTNVQVGMAPEGVAITPDGTHAYVTNSNSDSVSVIATATNSVVATVPVGRDPFGVAITPGPVTFACPLGQGFWENHPGAWPVTSLTLGSQTYTQAELLALFDTPPRGDASLILAQQLIAAKLNIANGSTPAPISSTIADADNLLSQFGGNRLPYNVRTSSAIGQQMVNDANVLDRYNNGDLTSNCTP
jgi:YVTN family beta-propeller protein